MSHGWGSSALVAMQETLLGVTLGEPDPDGRVRVVVAPPAAGLERARGSVPTIAGPVLLAWQRRGTGMTMALTVPANATATVRLPAATSASIQEGGVAAARAPGVTVGSAADGVVALSVGSGTYRFTST
jgi:alpha-L-rhamnosidase